MADEPFRADTDGDKVAERFRFGRVASVAIGAITGALGLGVADVVATLVSIPVALVEVATFAVDVTVARVLGGPLAFLNSATAQATTFVADLGILGFAAGVALVVVTAFLAARAREVAT